MIEFIGYLATAASTAQFVPQVVRTTRSGDISGLSAGMYVILLGQAAAWIGYGIRQALIPSIITNVMFAICGFLMLRLMKKQAAPHITLVCWVVVALITLELGIFVLLPENVLGATTAFFAFLLFWPQAIVSVRVRDLSGLSRSTWCISIGTALLWMTYGLARGVVIIWLSAIQAVCLSLVVLFRLALWTNRHAV